MHNSERDRTVLSYRLLKLSHKSGGNPTASTEDCLCVTLLVSLSAWPLSLNLFQAEARNVQVMGTLFLRASKLDHRLTEEREAKENGYCR